MTSKTMPDEMIVQWAQGFYVRVQREDGAHVVHLDHKDTLPGAVWEACMRDHNPTHWMAAKASVWWPIPDSIRRPPVARSKDKDDT